MKVAGGTPTVHVFFGCGKVVVTDVSKREEPRGRGFQGTIYPEEIR